MTTGETVLGTLLLCAMGVMLMQHIELQAMHSLVETLNDQIHDLIERGRKR